jgi:uncharacterized protein (DUF608 family)
MATIRDAARSANIPTPLPETMIELEPQRTFSGAALAEIAFPLGGIGTGTISLGGRGQLRDWEIFNRPSKGLDLPYSFVAMRTRAADAELVARVCEGRLAPPYSAGFGLSTGHLAGLPRMAECRFRGEYPFAFLDLADQALGLAVHLEAWNPFIPLDDEASGLPVAILMYTLRNATASMLDVTLVASMMNPLGLDGTNQYRAGSNHRWRNRPIYGGNLNEWVDEPGIHGIRMTRPNLAASDPRFGSLALATTAPNPTFTVRWLGRSWLDDAQRFWDGFLATGHLNDDAAAEPSPPNYTDVASVGAMLSLAPGAEATIPVLITWHLPNLVNYWNGNRGIFSESVVAGKRLGNYYATRFGDAWDVARHVAANLPALLGRTQAFHDSLFSSTLPAPVLDAVSANMSIIRTTTSLRTEDGAFHAFEGSGDTEGSCPMDCTHVWNYEQALAHLFPRLERSMRETDFLADLFPDGAMAFRSLLPLGLARWEFKPAADGQMGSIARVYREWQLSGDTEWLRSLWPAVRRALEFTWVRWDPDRDGVMDGEQHNTYDVEFYGPNTMVGCWYLAALKAGAVMARALGEPDCAQEYEAIYLKGRQAQDALLWNGEYYIQRIPAPEDARLDPTASTPWHASAVVPGDPEIRYQYGTGCLADQLTGQWFAETVGLGDLLPAEHVRAALRSLIRYNWRTNLSDHTSVQRVYALDDEPALLLCTWPHGGRPTLPFPYADEAWTGVEYAVAAHCIQMGLVEEGLDIVRGVRSRHDGQRRNPWNEVECGHHYARAMSSWALLLALSGVRYSAPEGQLRMAPAINAASFRCFFSTGSCWGTLQQEVQGDVMRWELHVVEGTLRLRSVVVRTPWERPARSAAVTARGTEYTAEILPGADGETTVQWHDELVASGQEMIAITLECLV